MKRLASKAFWEAYRNLPEQNPRACRQELFLAEGKPQAPLFATQESGELLVRPCRLSLPALAIDVDEGLLWFWIGSHADYDDLIK